MLQRGNHNDEEQFENAFDAFLERWTYDAAEDALFAAIRAAFMAGWIAAGGPESQNFKISQPIPKE